MLCLKTQPIKFGQRKHGEKQQLACMHYTLNNWQY